MTPWIDFDVLVIPNLPWQFEYIHLEIISCLGSDTKSISIFLKCGGIVFNLLVKKLFGLIFTRVLLLDLSDLILPCKDYLVCLLPMCNLFVCLRNDMN